MPESLRRLLHGIVDYAGLFPPAALSMDESVNRYAGHLHSEHRWMLSHFICPASQLDVFEQAAAPHWAHHPWSVSLLTRGGADVDTWCAELGRGLDLAQEVRSRNQDGIRTAAVECPAPDELVQSGSTDAISAWLGAAAKVLDREQAPDTVFIELPAYPIARTASIMEAISLNQPKGHTHWAVKLRTGGVEAAAFPGTNQVADFVHSAHQNGVPVKFTAGLHHPFRHFSESVDTKMHGFINVFLGSALTASGAIDAQQLVDVLEDQDPGHFHFGSEYASWQSAKITLENIDMARGASALSFGSCSFSEPVEDLKQAGWL